MKIFDILLERLLKEKIDRRHKMRDQDFQRKLRLAIPAQGAVNASFVVLALGQAQLNLNSIFFCREFDTKTKEFDPEIMLNVSIFALKNKSFFFVVKIPSVSFLVYEYLNSLKFDKNFSFLFDYKKKLPLTIFYQIAFLKSKFTGNNIFIECKTLKSTLKSMHIQIINDIIYK